MDPRNIPTPQLEKMRSEMAAAHKIEPYRRYGEEEAAALNQCDYTTQKRRRKTGGVPHVLLDSGRVKYLGLMIIDYQLFGSASCLLWGGSLPEEAESQLSSPGEANTTNGNSSLAISGFPNDQAAKPGTEPGLTGKPSKPVALASALRILKPQKKS